MATYSAVWPIHTARGGTNTDITTTWTPSAFAPATVTGSLAWLAIATRSSVTNAGVPTAITGTNAWGGTWSLVTSIVQGATGDCALAVYWSTVQSVASGSITITFGATQTAAIYTMIEFVNASAVAPVQSRATATTSVTDPMVVTLLSAFATAWNINAGFVAVALNANPGGYIGLRGFNVEGPGTAVSDGLGLGAYFYPTTVASWSPGSGSSSARCIIAAEVAHNGTGVTGGGAAASPIMGGLVIQ